MFGWFKKPVPVTQYVNPVNRRERLEINLAVDKARIDKHEADLRTLFGNLMPSTAEGDTLKVLYYLDISYIGNVIEKLAAIERLLDDRGVVREAQVTELLHGKCLIKEVLAKLTAIGKKL